MNIVSTGIEGLDVILELASDESLLRPERQNTLFEPSEVELSEVTRALLAEVERVKPSRLVFDSL